MEWDDNYDGDDNADDCDDDDDNDGAADDVDSDDNNEFACNDDDGDTCDECSSGKYDSCNDGADNGGVLLVIMVLFNTPTSQIKSSASTFAL